MLQALRTRWYGETGDDDSLSAEALVQEEPWWSFRGFTARRYATLVESMLQRTTPAVGEYMFSYIAEPGSAAASEDSAVAIGWRATWIDIEADLNAKLRRKLGVAENPVGTRINALRLRHWPTAYPLLWPSRGKPQPLRWLRARILHSCFPADQEPSSQATAVLVLLNCSAAFQLCNWATLARLALIDRVDEYQLVSFLVTNKAYHFLVYGLIQLAQNAAAYFNCVMLDAGTRHPCSDTAPGGNVCAVYARPCSTGLRRMPPSPWRARCPHIRACTLRASCCVCLAGAHARSERWV